MNMEKKGTSLPPAFEQRTPTEQLELYQQMLEVAHEPPAPGEKIDTVMQAKAIEETHRRIAELKEGHPELNN